MPVVANLVARDGDAALYQRFLDRKRTSAADDPEEEERFLYALASFEAPALVDRTLALTFTDDVRPQDRALVLSRLLGARAVARRGVGVRPRRLGGAHPHDGSDAPPVRHPRHGDVDARRRSPDRSATSSPRT